MVVVFIEIVNVSKCIAHDEDLENLLLSLQDCVERTDRNEFPGNFNFLEHLRDNNGHLFSPYQSASGDYAPNRKLTQLIERKTSNSENTD
jgi:hypothetical protein